jgi:CRISPR-associated protein (TIGR03986 family)
VEIETERAERGERVTELRVLGEAPNIAAPQANDAIVLEGKLLQQNGSWKVGRGNQNYPADLPQSIQSLGGEAKGIRVTFEIANGRAVNVRPIDQLPISGADAKFHHPYYFLGLPAPADAAVGHSKSLGHSVARKDHFSGKVRVTLTTKTPLLIPDAAQFEFKKDQRDRTTTHKMFATRSDAQGNPLIPVTSVKGMLRSAYEAITDSRLTVFSGHEDRLGYRQQAKEALCLLPARITKHGDCFHVQLLTGNAQPVVHAAGSDNNPHAYQVIGVAQNGRGAAAWIAKYSGDGDTMHRYSDAPGHGTQVFGLFEDKTWNSNQTHNLPITRFTEVVGGEPGWMSVTNRSFSRKHDERVFFNDAGTIKLDTAASMALSKLWRNVVADYKAQHDENQLSHRAHGAKPWDWLGKAPGKTAWSRHIYTRESELLDDGALCYVRLAWKGAAGKTFTKVSAPPASGALLDGSITASDVEIKYLSPVQIGRELFDESPLTILDKPFRPAQTHGQSSAADRLFGFVAGDSKDQDKQHYRGHVRITPIKLLDGQSKASVLISLDTGEFNQLGGLPLAILGAPKPAQSPFYIAKMDGKKKAEGYRNGQTLAGRKVYPHQRQDDDYWKDPKKWVTNGDRSVGKEYIRVDDDIQGSQNRTLKDWIAPGAKFSFDLFFENVSEADLAPLLWLLKLPKDHFHKLGGGKPYGFGSVALELDELSCELRSFEQTKARYDALPCQAVVPSKDQPTTKSLIKSWADSSQNNASVKQFLRAAKGFEPVNGNSLPTHYPRQTAHPVQNRDDKFAHIYGWFVENEKGGKFALRQVGDLGLRYTPKRPPSGSAGGNGTPSPQKTPLVKDSKPPPPVPASKPMTGQCPSWIPNNSKLRHIQKVFGPLAWTNEFYQEFKRLSSDQKKIALENHIRRELQALGASAQKWIERYEKEASAS